MTIPLITNDSNNFSHLINQSIFISSENSSVFKIISLEDPELTTKIDNVLLNLAILEEGGFTSSSKINVDTNNSLTSIAHNVLTKSIILKQSDMLNSKWNRNKSGNWSYIVT